MDCVLCGSSSTLHVATYRPSISADRQVLDVAVENRLCGTCGTVFNAGGCRQKIARLIDEAREGAGEDVRFDAEDVSGNISGILELVEETRLLATSGTLLEIGGGRSLLVPFSRRFPGWSLHGIAVRPEDTEELRRLLPGARIHEGDFETLHLSDRAFDLVVLGGVLACVTEPVDFLRRLRAWVAPEGRVALRVSNFESRPEDLLVCDRRTRWTPEALDVLYRRTGFEVEARRAPADRPWLFDVLSLREAAGGAEDDAFVSDPERVARARRLASRHLDDIRRAQLGFAAMLDALDDFEVAAVFGFGILGILELHRCGIRGQNVRYILEDSPGLWGTHRHGREIHSPEAIHRLGVRKVFLAGDRKDHERMRSRLLALGLVEADIYA